MAAWLPARTPTDSIKVRRIVIRTGFSQIPSVQGVTGQSPKQYAKLKMIRIAGLEASILKTKLVIAARSSRMGTSVRRGMPAPAVQNGKPGISISGGMVGTSSLSAKLGIAALSGEMAVSIPSGRLGIGIPNHGSGTPAPNGKLRIPDRSNELGIAAGPWKMMCSLQDSKELMSF